jgi:hypothetical protein
MRLEGEGRVVHPFQTDHPLWDLVVKVISMEVEEEIEDIPTTPIIIIMIGHRCWDHGVKVLVIIFEYPLVVEMGE